MTTLINVCTREIWQATVIFKSAVSSVVILMNQPSLDIFNPRILFSFYVILKNPVSSLAIFKFSERWQ